MPKKLVVCMTMSSTTSTSTLQAWLKMGVVFCAIACAVLAEPLLDDVTIAQNQAIRGHREFTFYNEFWAPLKRGRVECRETFCGGPGLGRFVRTTVDEGPVPSQAWCCRHRPVVMRTWAWTCSCGLDTAWTGFKLRSRGDLNGSYWDVPVDEKPRFFGTGSQGPQ